MGESDAVRGMSWGSSNNFYTGAKRKISHEVERLKGAAIEIANPVSEAALAPFLRTGDTVLDIGAGADANLGQDISQSGLEYIAVEPNVSFVDILNRAGIDVRQGDVVDLPIESNSVDAVHMRFLFGWLNEEQKRSALRHAARVLNPGEQKAVTIIDYDWMMTDGPTEYMEAVGIACDALDSFGFDYRYGADIDSDIGQLMSQNVFESGVAYEALPVEVHEIIRTIESGLPLLEEAVGSLREGLGLIGDIQRIEALERALKNIQLLDPETTISLPGIVTQTILFTKDQPSLGQQGSKFEPLIGLYEVGDRTPTSINGVFKVRRGSSLDDDVRKLQAYEYLKNGMLTSEAMVENGMLCEESYPKKYLDRSTLFVTMSEGGMEPHAAVRLIETEEGEDPDGVLKSLPTADHIKLSMDNRDVFPEGLPASGVFEVSSSLRNSREGGTFLDMSKSIIALAAEAKARGYHTALMSTQVKMCGILKKIFGNDNFKIITEPYKSDIPGASESMDFVSMSVDMRYFFERLWEHSEKTKATSRTSKDISALLEDYLSYQEVA